MMSRTKLVASHLAVGTVAGLLALGLGSSDSRDVSEATASRAAAVPSVDRSVSVAAATDESESQALRVQLDALASRLAALEERRTAASPDAPEPDRPDLQTEPEAEPRESADRGPVEVSPVVRIEEALAQEPLDAGWSAFASRELHDALSRDSAACVAVHTADCWSTHCRMEVALDFERVEEGLHVLGTHLPWDGELFVHVDDPDSGLAIAYLARAEHRLPRFSD